MMRWAPWFAWLLLLPGCGDGSRRYDSPDVTGSHAVTLHKAGSQGHVHGFSIPGTSYSEPLSGPVDFTWGGDWYGDAIEVHCEPSSVTGGHLRLRYRFSDI